MSPADRDEFALLLSDALAFYRQDVSAFTLDVWWQACRPFALEQVRKALTQHALDAERGRFAPMPADIVRALEGTVTDASLVAWGKVLGAMRSVGAWRSVAFDDLAIHAAIVDLGGWTTICAGTVADLSHLQRRFCESYRAYSARSRRGEAIAAPRWLAGLAEAENGLRGYAAPPPELIGDRERARALVEAADATAAVAFTPSSSRRVVIGASA